MGDSVRTGADHQGASMFLQRLWVYLSTLHMFCFMVGMTIFTRVMHFISPSLTKKLILRMGEKITMTQNPNFKYEDWGLTFGSMEFIKTASRHMWMSLGQEAFEGRKAPDSPVVSMEGEKTSICKYLKAVIIKQYLLSCHFDVLFGVAVVNWYSLSPPPDGWAFTNNFDISEHRSLEERLCAARILVKKEPLCPVVVDEMDNVAAIKYGALPERLYVLQAGKIVYRGAVGPWGYNPQEVRSFLEKIK
ncbi:hypothetical protein L3Q82_025823 [Scortum barcoo]|uniref:Uncharacterized protein n=1 Tax=Scortum barcoo TaxID=214431 RepID=A0ACB8WNH3_9TELE|nr:hypothetical protein L3Q82_025823 [Scortum barcoo]